MIVGIGLDLVETDRIRSIYERFGHRFAEKVLTGFELEMLPDSPVNYLASRFAAKEAGVKALGTGFSQGVTLKHLEVRNNPKGKPELFFLGPALDLLMTMGVHGVHLSISHGRDTAAAMVVLEKSR